MKTVDILLSTYNGEKYLNVLLESLLHQTYKNIHIIVRDDASSDNTTAIIKEYKNKYKDIFEIIPSKKNLGYKLSFKSLISHSNGDYICFCDQDDFWNEDKIEIYVNKMDELELSNKNMPILLTSEIDVVDETLDVIYGHYYKMNKINPSELNKGNVLCWPQGPGWTLMFNKSLKNKLVFPSADNSCPHDMWLVMSAVYFGKYYMIDKITGKYRQTGHNKCGYKNDKSLKHIWDMYQRSKNKLMYKKRNYASIFLNTYKEVLTNEDKKVLNEFINLNKHCLIKKISLIVKYHYYVKSIKHNLPIMFY